MGLSEKIKLKTFVQPQPINLKYPVLLCHGFGAIAIVLNKSPLHDVSVLYRLHGIKSFAPNIVPYASIETRARAWETILPKVLHYAEADKLHIVAHSMGGLDIRHLLQKPEVAEKVVSLTTVATPHYGTTLSELTLDAPKIIRENIVELVDWFGNQLYPQIPSDVLTALKELTPDYIKNTFNPANPDVEGVIYSSVNAEIGKDTDASINKLLVPFNIHIYEREGKNDGYVPSESAKWGDLLLTSNLSHLEQIRINLPKAKNPDWNKLWLNVAQNLRVIEDGLR